MKLDNPGHHLEQMVRQTRAHHAQLSQMADAKAQMLIMVASIVIPLTMQYLNDELLRGPATMMIVFMTATICFAAYAVMPGRSRTKKMDPSDPLFNPMFFGDFHQLSYDAYLKEMERIMADPAVSYEVMLREIYGMGVYLAEHKYKYVRRGYFAFISGVTLSLALGLLVWLTTTPAFIEAINPVVTR